MKKMDSMEFLSFKGVSGYSMLSVYLKWTLICVFKKFVYTLKIHYEEF